MNGLYDNNNDNYNEMINNLKIEENNNQINTIDLNNNCDLIITNLNNINDKITKYYNSSTEDISNYISFLNSFSSQLLQIGNIFKESQKKINNNIFNINLFDNFNNYNSIITEKFSDLSLQIQRSIISPFEIYKEKYNSENNNIINNLKKFIEKIISKNNYLNQIKKEYEEEKKKYECEENKDNKIKIKEKLEEHIELYKYKVNEINLFLMDCKNESNTILDEIINKHTIKNQSVKNSIKNYFDIMDNFFSKSNEDINVFKNKINEISMSITSDQFSNNIKKKMNEIKWETNGKNSENKINKINNTDKNEIDIKNKKIEKNNDKQVQNMNNNNNNSIFTKDNSSKNYKIKINDFISDLLSNNKFPENEAAEFLILLSEDNLNLELYSYFCNCFNRYRKKNNNTIQKFLNFNNFTHFSNILNLIIENLSSNNILKQQYDKYLLLDKIICIGEESVYENTFICSLLSNNKKLKNETLWILCMTYKLIYELNKVCENYYALNSKGKKILGYGMHFLEKISINKNIKKIPDDFITKKGYNKFIPHYNDLDSETKDKICKKDIIKLMHNILKKYICHMTNYNYPLEGIYKLIETVYFEYFIDKEPELMNFYINYSIASSFSVRTFIPISSLKKNNKSDELKLKIKQIKKHKYLVENKKYFSLDVINNKYIILKNILIFLNNSEKIKLINLNKELYGLLRKEIYHHILLNLKKNISFNINEHIQIWKCFLKCNSLYKKLGFENKTYDSIIKDINSNQDILKNFKNELETIDLDIPRSPFKQDKQSSSKAIKNILYAFLYINNYNNNKNKISYYQGMNYIVTFLYEMVHNEEDCLLLFSGLIYSTEYFEIFSENMEKMQKYLYVVERLVYLYLPKIFSHLSDNNLQLNFFVNPIFVSLFTNIYSSLPENDFSFLLEIWDDFILNGWKTIFTDVLAILKQNENKILNLNSEDLIKYLSNGITNGEMFTIYNYDEFKKEKNKYQPSNQLLELLSKESTLEEKLK